MIEFKDLKITPEVQDQIDRGVDPIKVIISVKEGHSIDELDAAVRALPGVAPGGLSKTDHYLFATLSSLQILSLAQSDLVRKVWLNRPAQVMMDSAAKTIGASYVWQDFGVTGRGVVWAVIDSGIDATHEALQGVVVRRFDLTEGDQPGAHGTHVAGIIAGRCDAKQFRGVAPDCKLVDFQVFGPQHKDMSLTIRAMEMIRKVNEKAGKLVIHGANVSIGSPNQQNVKQFMPGHSPECEEANRLVQSGVVVCVAAGNYGAQAFLVPGKDDNPDILATFVEIGITDPGNAELPITVGSTHKENPMRYGISPFSSRGPTGDGRVKPDLVAPGEKIISSLPGDQYAAVSGTSQATPMVSGAAALLLSAYRALVGRPDGVKEILLESCKDLGRVQHFQGAGLLDIRRAIEIARGRYSEAESVTPLATDGGKEVDHINS